MPDSLIEDARRLGPELRELRRRLHRNPESGLQLPTTQAMLLAQLEPLGLEITLGKGATSITAVLRGAAPGETVLLRSDMDGLPINEGTDLEFRSVNGAMHACGHDLHMAGLVGAARLLAARRGEIAGDVVFMFQPGEEGHHGAQAMLDEGVLEASGVAPSRAYAIHVFADIPSGTFMARPGYMMAAVDQLDITVNGTGGHGGMPHRTIDPIPIAAEIVLAIQAYVARRIGAFEPAVVTIGEFHAGTARHVVPSSALLSAGVRSFDTKTRDRISSDLQMLAKGIAKAHGATAKTRFESTDPVTVNDASAVAEVERVVSGLLGAGRFVENAQPSTMAEDFSRILERVPGAMVFLGAAPSGVDLFSAPSNHSNMAVFDDAVVPDAACVLAGLVLHSLRMA